MYLQDRLTIAAAMMLKFKKPVHPKEWGVVPLSVIDETIERLRKGSIAEVMYDPSSALLVLRE